MGDLSRINHHEHTIGTTLNNQTHIRPAQLGDEMSMICGPSGMEGPLKFSIFRWCLERPTSNPWPWLWVLFALVIHATGSSADVLNLDSVNGGTESLEIAKDQIETGEYEEAIRLAEIEIGRTEAIWGRYDIALVEPLVVLGDGLTGYGDYESAPS